MGPQLLSKLALFGLIEFGSEYRLHAARWKRRLHHHGIEMIQHPIERVRLPAPPGRDGRKLQLLAKQMPGKAGKKRHDRGRLNQAASQCIGDDTFPATMASTRPGTPSSESLRNSRGSQKLSSTRRKITSTRSNPSTVLR
jgi:hypothetical protein